MPYIPFEQRQETLVDYHQGFGIKEPGELAFIIADALDSFTGEQYDFTRLAQALGALESARLEFYGAVVAPYEDQKREDNGEVFVLSRPQTQVTSGPGWPE